ncbi:MAG: DUF2782 domain-containing protein [Methylococcaceae bacterium]|nr:DUF2782 domain-containing protein [Methylococcaceae bacterium]
MRRLLVLILLVPALCFAEEETEEVMPMPEMPDMPEEIESDEAMEPDITIIRKGKKTIQEFRKNGDLYMVKIIPDIGPAYYLIDTDGDGNMDVRGSDLDREQNIHQWKLLEW